MSLEEIAPALCSGPALLVDQNTDGGLNFERMYFGCLLTKQQANDMTSTAMRTGSGGFRGQMLQNSESFFSKGILLYASRTITVCI